MGWVRNVVESKVLHPGFKETLVVLLGTEGVVFC